ncbi:hypothetical protein LguiA_026530 [Lonicera macranthoides]
MSQNTVRLFSCTHVEHFINMNLRALPSRTLLVGNIHVLFNPNCGDIKLGQAKHRGSIATNIIRRLFSIGCERVQGI